MTNDINESLNASTLAMFDDVLSMGPAPETQTQATEALANGSATDSDSAPIVEASTVVNSMVMKPMDFTAPAEQVESIEEDGPEEPDFDPMAEGFTSFGAEPEQDAKPIETDLVKQFIAKAKAKIEAKKSSEPT